MYSQVLHEVDSSAVCCLCEDLDCRHCSDPVSNSQASCTDNSSVLDLDTTDSVESVASCMDHVEMLEHSVVVHPFLADVVADNQQTEDRH